MSGAELARILWRRRLVVGFVILVVVGGGALFLSRQKKVYQSSATVALLPNTSNPTFVSLYGDMVKNLLPTYGQVVDSRSFLDTVAPSLPFSTTGAFLRSHVHADPGIGVMKIVAT